MAIWDPTTKFNFHQYLWLYGTQKKYNFSLTKEPLIVDLSLYENNLFKPNRNPTFEHNDEDSPFSSSRQPDT